MRAAKHTLSIPEISGYEIRYYFQERNNKQQALVYPHHIHDRLELYVLLEGDVSFAVESSVYKLSIGDAVVIKPNEVHNCILDSDSIHKHMCFWFDCSNEFLFKDFIQHEFGRDNLISPTPEYKKRIFELYPLLKSATEEDDKQKLFYLSLEMLDIFRKFISVGVPKTILPTILKDILDDIDVNFKDIKSLSYFTQKYFISQSTLNRLFKQHLHTSPKYYLETKRLAYSRILLKKGATVLNACIESGFTDYSNYIRLFKNRFSITPKQYRDS